MERAEEGVRLVEAVLHLSEEVLEAMAVGFSVGGGGVLTVTAAGPPSPAGAAVGHLKAVWSPSAAMLLLFALSDQKRNGV